MNFTTPQQVCDEANIRAVLNRYSRAIDRCDMELLKTVYWPDAIDDHAIFVGNPVEFAEFVTPILRDRTKATMHTLSNTMIELEGDVALTETYVRAYHHMEHNGKKVDVILGGRYLDRFARRNGEWRVAERTFVLDWDVDGAVGGEVDEVHLVSPPSRRTSCRNGCSGPPSSRSSPRAA